MLHFSGETFCMCSTGPDWILRWDFNSTEGVPFLSLLLLHLGLMPETRISQFCIISTFPTLILLGYSQNEPLVFWGKLQPSSMFLKCQRDLSFQAEKGHLSHLQELWWDVEKQLCVTSTKSEHLLWLLFMASSLLFSSWVIQLSKIARIRRCEVLHSHHLTGSLSLGFRHLESWWCHC